MNASEILEQIRAQIPPEGKVASLTVEYDYGSVDDQLWQEHAFHPGVRDGQWITVKEIPGSPKLAYEVLIARDRKTFQYHTFQVTPGSKQSRSYLEREYIDLILTKRDDLGL